MVLTMIVIIVMLKRRASARWSVMILAWRPGTRKVTLSRRTTMRWTIMIM
jgi:hypothetical protein